MAGVVKTRSGHDNSYEAVVSGTSVQAGDLVVPSTKDATNAGVQGITVAGDAAADTLGVAASLAVPAADQNTSGTLSNGYPVAYPHAPDALTTVYRQCEVDVTYDAAAVGYGVKLCASASGNVRAWVSGTDGPETLVGSCAEVGGVGASGGVAKAYIY